jgi:hypothetical protein
MLHLLPLNGGWSEFVKNFGIGILLNAKVERLHSEQLANGLLPPTQKYEAGLGVMPAFLEWMPKAPNPGQSRCRSRRTRKVTRFN